MCVSSCHSWLRCFIEHFSLRLLVPVALWSPNKLEETLALKIINKLRRLLPVSASNKTVCVYPFLALTPLAALMAVLGRLSQKPLWLQLSWCWMALLTHICLCSPLFTRERTLEERDQEFLCRRTSQQLCFSAWITELDGLFSSTVAPDTLVFCTIRQT